ncbi:RNA polymerase sigma factor [Kineococcus arenarius]|uniref:RNA polymerase sigma factor n=1 Tax=unclassified Kineococcus TaxID=2621656 RepID=UPI003D7EB8D7
MSNSPDEPGQLVFEHWYRRELPRVRQALTLATGDPALAEEATAEAFARALVHWPRLRTTASPAGWVYTTALNQVRRSWRRALLEHRYTRRHRDEPVHAPELPDPALWRAVAELPERARTAIALRYIADLTENEVAAAMNVSRGTVATTLSRARATLAAQLNSAAASTPTAPSGPAPSRTPTSLTPASEDQR